MNELTHIDLFAGIAGFSLGFHRAGIKTLAYVEKDANSQKVLKYHFPDAIHLDDVCTSGKHNLPYADIVSFGSPCQDLSVAGKRKGLTGERSGLFWQAIRIVDELKPAFAVWENVPGAYTSNSGRDFANVLGAFWDIGACDIAWTTLDSQYFRVAQRRRRCFLVADFRGERAAEILFERDGGEGHPQPRNPARQGTAPYVIKGAAIGRRPENGPQYGEISADGTVYTLNTSEVHAVAGTLPASGAGTARTGNERNEASFLVIADGFDTRNMKVNPNLSATLQTGSDLNSINPVVFNKQRTDSYQPASVEPTLAARDYKDAGDLVAFMGGQGAKAGGIAASNTTSPTLKGVPSGTNQTPSIAGDFGVRRLTPTECERLQGFPTEERCVIIDLCLDNQSNFASVEIQNHKSPKPVGNAEKTGLVNAVKFAENNLNPSNLQTNEHAQLNVVINCAENGVEIHSQGKCYLSASFAADKNLFHQFTHSVDFALLVVGLNTIAEQITLIGKEGLPVNELNSIPLQNGENSVKLSGSEIMQLANGAMSGLITNRKLLKSITSDPLNTKLTAMNLITLYCSVLNAISGYIPSEILQNSSLRIEINSSFGWTFGASDSTRYKQLGNAVTVNVLEWLGRRIMEAAK